MKSTCISQFVPPTLYFYRPHTESHLVQWLNARHSWFSSTESLTLYLTITSVYITLQFCQGKPHYCKPLLLHRYPTCFKRISMLPSPAEKKGAVTVFRIASNFWLVCIPQKVPDVLLLLYFCQGTIQQS